MTVAPIERPWWRLSRSSLIALLVATAVGIGIGVLVQLVSPNPVYGLQIEVIGLALLIAIVVAVIPVARRLLPLALGLAIGVIVGIGVGPGSPGTAGAVTGSVTVRLGLPEIVDGSSSADCVVVDGALTYLSTPIEGTLRFADGRRLDMSIGPGEVEPAALDRPLDVVVTIRSTLADGSPTDTRMASDASSTISISNAGATGSMAFSGLVIHHASEQREPIDVAGTVTWDCAP